MLGFPELVGDEDILIAPIVSSVRALKLINRIWSKKYNRLPDFVVLEGKGAGGHLGYKRDELEGGKGLEELTVEIAEYLKDKEIPLFVAGSVFDGYDLRKYRGLGATGVQIGTRFIGTYECDADERFKDLIINSGKEDLVIIDSPVGIPGRAIMNNFLREIEVERKPSERCINCLKTCNPKTTQFCISDALINAVKGNIDEGLIFAGSNVDRVEKKVSVKSIIESIIEEYGEI